MASKEKETAREKDKPAMSFSVDTISVKELKKLAELAKILKKKKIRFEV